MDVFLTDLNGTPIGIGHVWETGPGEFSWVHPDSSQGVADSFENAVIELKSCRIPDEFTMTVSKEDRLNAGPYHSIQSCLLATTAQRMFGDLFDCMGVSQLWLNKSIYKSLTGEIKKADLNPIEGAAKAPFYGPEVVGKKFTFRFDRTYK